MNMNRLLLSVILLLFSISMFSQQRNLDYYLEQAKKNSPLINKNKNDNKIVRLDLQQTERILKSPVISLESNLLFAPIISSDAVPSTFDIMSNGSSIYTGYDLGITNGGQYQAYISVKQPLLGKTNLKPYTQKADISRKQNEKHLMV